MIFCLFKLIYNLTPIKDTLFGIEKLGWPNYQNKTMAIKQIRTQHLFTGCSRRKAPLEKLATFLKKKKRNKSEQMNNDRVANKCKEDFNK